ncbi:endogenous retrovirus group K member 19 Pro protein-like [Motacilla alba alba]|uniref:endogenous retrovirus group K member 19 Pro protein-like n=1 Tax=Motacilla alba alba TaxID=1094192 RepID=UPI0018D53E4E|nr:endogenous retrovirus group K member 19 Pro protein-like [Motacilla alba alba]XP_037982588.1 endogenous retrovirus group K member 19 Pro protein-like [Motacilla alba alba]
MWAQVVGPSKPTIECGLTCRGEKFHLPGMLDTGADVTIIARSEWPAHWDLQPVPGMISGIGGATVSMRSKNNVLVKGPEGKLATIRPFVLFPEAIIHHYMDDILVCASEKAYLDKAVKKTIETIEKAGFEIREDKIQYTNPWTYLGFQIRERTIVPQQLAI